MRVKVLVDDLVPEGVRAVHGFSALVESGDVTVLFDTGPDGGVMMEALEREGVDLLDVDLVVVSHSHMDHCGGLSRLLFEHPRLTVSAPLGSAAAIEHMLPRGAVVLREGEPRGLGAHLSVTGDLGGPIPEQAMVLESQEGPALLVGCGHPGIRRLLEAVGGSSPLVIGGIHDMRPEDLSLEGLSGMVVCHCTPSKRTLAHMSDDVTLGGVGTVVELEPPPDPLTLARSSG